MAMTHTLVSLPLEMLWRIAARMEIRSLIRLQMTCRDLFFKCEFAQRLQEVHVAEIRIKYDEMDRDYYFFFGKDDDFRLSEEEFGETGFRFHADILNFCDPLGEVAVDKAFDCLHRRGTVDQLTVAFPEEKDEVMDFSCALKVFSISVDYPTVPTREFWQMPSFNKIKEVDSYFLIPMSYFAEVNFENVALLVEDFERDNFDLNLVLKKWADGQKTIKCWRLSGFCFDEEQLFKDFHSVPNLQDKSKRRPLLILDDPVAGRHRESYLLKRADGTMLRVRYRYYKGFGGLLRIDDIDVDEEMEDRDLFTDSEDSTGSMFDPDFDLEDL